MTAARARIVSRTRFSGVTFPNDVNTTASSMIPWRDRIRAREPE